MRFTSKLLAAIAAAALPAAAGAQLTTFTARSDFQAAAGTLTTETFNAATQETSFETTPVGFGAFSVLGFGNQFNRNFVDIPPVQFSQFNIDGTTILNAVTFTGSGLTFTFADAISAFGADFGGLQDNRVRTTITAGGRTVTPPVVNGGGVSFFGFRSITPFTTVTFLGSSQSDGFGIDNVSFAVAAAAAAAAVPEPATWAMMIAGVGAVGGAMRVRRRRAAVAFA